MRARPRVSGVDAERTPVGMRIGAGTVAVLAATTLAATLPASPAAWRLVPVALTLVAIGVFTVDPLTVGVLTVLACPLVIGFLVNRHGALSWHGTADTYRLGALVLCAGTGLLIGSARRRRRDQPLIVPLTGPEPARQPAAGRRYGYPACSAHRGGRGVMGYSRPRG